MEYTANKTDKARTIVCAFYNLQDLPKPTDNRVKRIQRTPMDELDRQWELAKQIIAERINRE